MRKHLAIFKKGIGEDILNGKKTIETRFSRIKIAPFSMISVGDLVFIKPVGKEIIGQFRVKKVVFWDGMEEADFHDIEKVFGKQIAVGNDYWGRKRNCKYGTLMFIGQVVPFITAPLKIPKKDLRGWVVLD